MKVEVAYAKPGRQIILPVQAQAGETVEEVIRRSGILAQFPEIDLEKQAVGVFSEPRRLTDEVKDGDRVEIYRELLVDPKEARRVRCSIKSI